MQLLSNEPARGGWIGEIIPVIMRAEISRADAYARLPNRAQTINGYMADLFTITAVHALHAGLHFKLEAYRHEQEYRFLRVYPPETPSPRAKVRDRAGAC